jgi:prepilin-type N-terminal cleavage/methylation domain-containing protein
MKSSQSGFTIVEIMITVLIVAVLAAVAIPNLLRSRVEAHDAAAKSALKAISIALETYSSTEHQYPSDTTSLIGVSPPYLSVDYFSGIHSGFTFTSNLSAYDYSATATPVSPTSGSGSFTITTGGLIVAN